MIKEERFIGCLGSLLESATEGHSDDCQNDCQLCLDLKSAKELLEEIDNANEN